MRGQPRLFLRKHPSGSAIWCIRDGKRLISTRVGESDVGRAHAALGAYITSKYQPSRKPRRLDETLVSDVVALYASDRLPEIATRAKAAARLLRVEEWFGAMTLDQLNGQAFRLYAKERKTGGARRELQDLQAAINYYRKEVMDLKEPMSIWLPPPGLPRQRWLTRDEVAKLVRICWRTEHGNTNTRPLRHLARLILFAVYTGSRIGDCLNASFRVGGKTGYVDVGSGLYFRRPSDKRETNKRQPTIPISARLLAHLRRWEANGAEHVCVYGGHACGSIKTAWSRLLYLADIGHFPPTTLRHTAATWMMQRGVSVWDCAGMLGNTPEMVQRVYGHHSPDHLKNAARALGAKK